MVATLKEVSPKEYLGLFKWQHMCVESGGTAHMVQGLLRLSHDKVLRNGSIGLASAKAMKTKSRGTYKAGLTGGTSTIKLNPMLLVYSTAHTSVPTSVHCDGYKRLFSKIYCVIKRKKKVAGVSKRIGRTYSLEFEKVHEDPALDIPDRIKHTLDIWHARLAHTDRGATSYVK